MSKSGSRMRAWYVCMNDGNGQWEPCGTVMPAKHWLRRFEDVGPRQRWYCVCCGARFRSKYGMLVEIHITSPAPTSIFMRSEVLNQDVDDVRAMCLQFARKPKRDLWQKIPDFKPQEFGDILRPCRESEFLEHEGFDKALIYKFINPIGMNDLPKCDWDSIFTFVDEGRKMRLCILCKRRRAYPTFIRHAPCWIKTAMSCRDCLEQHMAKQLNRDIARIIIQFV